MKLKYLAAFGAKVKLIFDLCNYLDCLLCACSALLGDFQSTAVIIY